MFYTPTTIENSIDDHFTRVRNKNAKLLKLLELEIRGITLTQGYDYNATLDRLQLEHEKIMRMNRAMNGF